MFAGVFSSKTWDRLGVFLTIGCAIHCFIMAILPRFLVSSAHDHCCHHDAESWSFHSVALIFVMIVGIGAFSRCCRSAGLFNFGKLVVGMSLMWAPFVYTAFAHHETAFTIAGASLVGWAHLTNLRNGGCHPAESKA